MLEATLDATATDGGVDLALSVRNAGSDPVELSFRDAQRAEFVAEDANGAEVWRYGDERMFGMATGSETLQSGESVTYDATWADLPPGDYRIRAWVVAEDADAAADLTVE